MTDSQSTEYDNQQQRLTKLEQKLKQLSSNDLALVEYLVNSLDESNMHYLGKFLALKQHGDEMVMDLGLQNENTYGVAQGGALYTLADVAIGFYILERLDKDQEVYTLEMKMNFIKKGIGEKLTAMPKIIQWGNRIVVTECTILDDFGEVVAHALGTFYISRGKGGKKA